jgi:hypothetical protein
MATASPQILLYVSSFLLLLFVAVLAYRPKLFCLNKKLRRTAGIKYWKQNP